MSYHSRTYKNVLRATPSHRHTPPLTGKLPRAHFHWGGKLGAQETTELKLSHSNHRCHVTWKKNSRCTPSQRMVAFAVPIDPPWPTRQRSNGSKDLINCATHTCGERGQHADIRTLSPETVTLCVCGCVCDTNFSTYACRYTAWFDAVGIFGLK